MGGDARRSQLLRSKALKISPPNIVKVMVLVGTHKYI